MFLEKYIYSKSKRSYIKLNDWKVVKLYFNSLANFLLANQERFQLLQHSFRYSRCKNVSFELKKTRPNPLIQNQLYSSFSFLDSTFIPVYLLNFILLNYTKLQSEGQIIYQKIIYFLNDNCIRGRFFSFLKFLNLSCLIRY